MYQLTYYSKANQNISQKDISDILNISTKSNQSQGLTGCLVFIENTFIQILEGDKFKIETLYKTLLADKRHTDLVLISKGYSSKRFFPEWGMAYCPISDKTSEAFKHFQRNLNLLLDLSQPTTNVENQFWIIVKLKLSQNRIPSQPGTE
ncbi:BLUF domain-containing protein [Mariniflexile ostreae]|uniref:BLUF domain-containing protein n=1 Tax=Mariniflexile ostreae TaxID=1520892 RepID=A0ABV5F8K4_9FLAO